jgi:hypothetical protein
MVAREWRGASPAVDLKDLIASPKVLEEALGKRLGGFVWRALIVAAVLASLGGLTFGAIHGFFVLKSDFSAAPALPQSAAPAPSQSPQPQGTVKVGDPKYCPPGYSVVQNVDIAFAQIGITMPNGARMCVIDSNIHDNKRYNVEVRPDPKK